MKKENKKYVNLKIISIVLIVTGIVYIIAGSTIAALWEYIQADGWGVVMLIEGIFYFLTACGLILKQLLPEKKLIICLLIGYLTTIIGIIVTLIFKSVNKNKTEYRGDKYENLEKLKKLKDEGVITEEEFNTEKKKILE